MLETDLAPAAADTTTYLRDYQEPDFLISKVELLFDFTEEATTVTATSTFQRNGDHARALRLDGEKFELLSIALDGATIAAEQYHVDATSLRISDLPDEFTLVVVTKLQPHLNTELSGLYKSSGNYCTQCEAEGFRRITYFLDRPDVLAEYEVQLTADKGSYPVLLANGNPVASGNHTDGRHWARWHDPHPKPSYLFALVVGSLESIQDNFTTRSGNEVALNIYTQAHNIDKCSHAMASLKNAMLWDEQVYGCEYDLAVYNIVAVDDFNMGAMENKGLNIFNSKYVLANQQTATDSDFQGIESVIAHEYFHNWSGNRVTCRDWFQLSLKEGFTVFRDQEFSADMGSRGVKRIRDVQALRTYQFKEDAGPMAHPIRPSSYQEINNFYTVTIYEKGAEVIRMLHRLLGTSDFRKATDLYFERFDGHAATTEDFVVCMEKASGQDLQRFRNWYTQAGTPQLKFTQNYDAGRGSLSLTVSQSCPATPGQAEKQPFVIPINVALLGATGELLEERMLVLTEAVQSFDFEDLAECPVVSVMRDFSAPVNVEFAQSDQQLAHLVQFEQNGFSRWDALQQLGLNLLLPAVRQTELKFEPAAYESLYGALAGLVDDVSIDKALLAEMLNLPVSSYIAEQCKPIDPQRVVDAREQLQWRLATDLEIPLLALYSSNHDTAEFVLSSSAMAQRALKNTALKLLVCLEQPKYFAIAEEQYYAATNMTDRLAAFAALLHSSYENKAALIADFYSHWQDDALVLDKWFTMQALTPEIQVLSAIHKLLDHPSFSITNPNKVRSLIGAFTANMRAFHRTDGAGYRLLADIVLKLNTINPQVGARLVSTLNNWRAYAEPYSSNMQQELQRINNEPALTKDIKEIVSKALENQEL